MLCSPRVNRADPRPSHHTPPTAKRGTAPPLLPAPSSAVMPNLSTWTSGQRDNEEEEVYQLLSDNYEDFLKMALDHPDLRLFTPEQTTELNDEQRERMFIIFSMLISLFERAYLLLYGPKTNARQQRRWRSWEDYMLEWCRRDDFRALLPVLLEGEDPEFSAYVRTRAAAVSPTGSLLLSS